MKKLMTTVLATTLLTLTGCSSSTSANSSTTADNGNATVITVGISPDYAPYESLDLIQTCVLCLNST